MQALLLALLIGGNINCFVKAWLGPALDNETGSLYYISEDLANEPQAAELCRQNGWIIATVKTSSQQNAIETLAETLPGNDDIWIGLRIYRIKGNPHRKGYGIWSDGTPFNVTKSDAKYHNWFSEEPRTYKTSAQTNQPTCVRLWTKHGWRWDDYYCTYGEASLSRYACETKQYYDEHTTTVATRQISQHFLNATILNGTQNELRNLSNTINELLKNGTSLLQAESTKFLKTFDNLLNEYDALKEGDFSMNTDIVEVKAAVFRRNESLYTNYTNINRTDNKIQIYLSPNLIEEASSRVLNSFTENNHIQVNTVLYRRPSLFQINRSRYEKIYLKDSNTNIESESWSASMFGEKATLKLIPAIISDVLSVDVRNVDMRDLKNPVWILNHDYRQNFVPPRIPDMISKVQPVCAFWDFNISSWSTKGCKVVEDTEEQTLCGSLPALTNPRVICACNHMTHFSILLDTTYIYAPEYLTHMTKLGCAISLICLFATITTILIFKQLRSKTPQQILLHLCIALLMVNLLFLIGIDGRDEHTFCTAISVLMHYFLLTAWAFMLLEAIFLFLRIVKASYRNGVEGKVVPIGSAMCYVIPSLICGITVGVTPEDLYLSKKYCWLSMESLIPSLLVPVAIILLINIVVFISVLYTITFKSKMFRMRVDMLRVRQTLTRALCMVFLLGVPWLFGFFMLLSQHPSAKEAFAVCFTIFNTTQGVAIFIFYCAKQKQVRELWLGPFHHRIGKAFRRARSSIRGPSSRRHMTSKVGNENEQDLEKSRSDESESKSDSNERSMATCPGSRTTLDTNIMEGNASQNEVNVKPSDDEP